VAALALLVPLIVPMFSLHLGQEDIAATPKETTERQAFDLLAKEYGPGYVWRHNSLRIASATFPETSTWPSAAGYRSPAGERSEGR
jgi:hypothetical protein